MKRIMIDGWDFSDAMTASEVARVFRVDRKTVVKWGDKGRLACFRTPGGHRRYSRQQVEYLLAGGR